MYDKCFLRIMKYGDTRVLQCREMIEEWVSTTPTSSGGQAQLHINPTGYYKYIPGKWVDVPVVDAIPKEGNL